VADSEEQWAKADAEWLADSRDGSLERPLFRMPVGFGRAASQRNHPTDKSEFVNPGKSPTFRVRAITDGSRLSQILPPGVLVRGEPRLEVSVGHVQEAYWLAGRDYHSLMVRVPVTVVRGEVPVDGYYYAVKWDSLPDLVMTAREDIGWPSIWADVSPPIRTGRDSYAFNASWLGYRFFEMEITDLGEPHPKPRDDPAAAVQVTYKYIPVGYGPGADTSKLIVNDLSTYWQESASIDNARTGRSEQPVSTRDGTGHFTFHRARWEDMPSQFHIVNALADLPIVSVLGAEANESPYM
jgi:hypothetical protein